MTKDLSASDVRSLMAALPHMRPVGIPFDSKAGCILVCNDADGIREAVSLQDRFAVAPVYTALSLHGDAARLSDTLGVRVVPIKSLRTASEREVVVMVSSGERRASLRKAVAVHRASHPRFHFPKRLGRRRAPVPTSSMTTPT